MAKRWKIPKWWRLLLGKECEIKCVLPLVLFRVCFSTLFVGCDKHRNAPHAQAHTHTVLAALGVFSAGTSLTQDVLRMSRDFALGVKIGDQSLQLRWYYLKLVSVTSSHSETTVGVNSCYARDPREPANLGDTREGLARRFLLAFCRSCFPKKKKKIEDMTIITLSYSEHRLLNLHFCDKYFEHIFPKTS